MFPLKNTEAYIHANGYRSTLGKELAARDAEITELGSEIQALTNEVRGNWATGGVNLFDPSQAIDGYIRDTNGEVGEAPNSKSTGYIAVVGEARYTITTTQTGSKWGAWYDSSKNFISGIKGNDYDNITAPSNAAFMRLTLQYDGNNPNWATTTQIEKGNTATPYQPYAKTNVELTQESVVQTATWKDSTTNFDFTVTKKNGICILCNSSSNGSVVSSGAPVEVGTIPTGFRPSTETRSMGIFGDSAVFAVIATTGGSLRFGTWSQKTISNAFFEIVYPCAE